MKKSTTLVIILLVLALIAFAVFEFRKESMEVVNDPQVVNTPDSIVGCYVAGTERDVFTLNITSVNEGSVSGNISFKNFEKDSSSGTFMGAYKDGILIGDYSFQSEGLYSIMQVAFKKNEVGFIRGYGEVDAETGSRFTSISTIEYDASSSLNVFSKKPCNN